MNCEQREQQILLAQSGELTAAAARELDDHVSRCDRCRAYRNTAGTVSSASAVALKSGLPSDRTLHRIRVAAVDNQKRVILFSRPAAAALAAAAAVAVAVGVWIMTAPGDPAHSTGSLDAIIMMVQNKDLDQVEYPASEERKTVRELADELLSLEGFSIEEFSDGDWSTSEEEPPATGLRLRSTPGSPSKICV